MVITSSRLHAGCPVSVSNEAEDCTLPFILGGSDTLSGLWKASQRWRTGDELPPIGNPMAIRIDLCAELRRDLPSTLIDHPDQRFRGATTCDARPRQRPLEAHLGHDSAGPTPRRPSFFRRHGRAGRLRATANCRPGQFGQISEAQRLQEERGVQSRGCPSSPVLPPR